MPSGKIALAKTRFLLACGRHPLSQECTAYACQVVTVDIPTAAISDAATFHDVVQRALRLPDYYGHNLDALDECLYDLATGETNGWHDPIVLGAHEILAVNLGEIAPFRKRCPELLDALLDVFAWTNLRLTEEGREPRIVVAYR